MTKEALKELAGSITEEDWKTLKHLVREAQKPAALSKEEKGKLNETNKPLLLEALKSGKGKAKVTFRSGRKTGEGTAIGINGNKLVVKVEEEEEMLLVFLYDLRSIQGKNI